MQLLNFSVGINFGGGGNLKDYSPNGFSPVSDDISTWTEKSVTELLFRLPPVRNDLRFEIEVFPFLAGRAVAQQQCWVYFNGLFVHFETVKFPTELVFTVSREMLTPRVNRLAFALPNAAAPKDLNIGNDLRLLGLAFVKLNAGDSRATLRREPLSATIPVPIVPVLSPVAAEAADAPVPAPTTADDKTAQSATAAAAAPLDAAAQAEEAAKPDTTENAVPVASDTPAGAEAQTEQTAAEPAAGAKTESRPPEPSTAPATVTAGVPAARRSPPISRAGAPAARSFVAGRVIRTPVPRTGTSADASAAPPTPNRPIAPPAAPNPVASAAPPGRNLAARSSPTAPAGRPAANESAGRGNVSAVASNPPANAPNPPTVRPSAQRAGRVIAGPPRRTGAAPAAPRPAEKKPTAE